MRRAFKTENNGPEIVTTDYWGSPQEKRGFYHLSINAGAFRLLVPDSELGEVDEWKTAKEVIISRGPWPDEGKSDALEIMFEDYTDVPYCIHIVSDAVDRMPSDSDRDHKGSPPRWIFSAWTRKGKLLEIPCRYRVVKKLPFLKKW